jgi:hypothetical protein
VNALEDWKKLVGNLVTNWQQPMPLPRKLGLLVRNVAIRGIKLQNCCGHHGEPGC